MNDDGDEAITNWPNGGPNNAAYIDFTNTDACFVYEERLNAMRAILGVNGFNFDAGETDWGRGVIPTPLMI